MFTIGKEFTFSASHTLDKLPEGHKCRRLHGHNYRLLVEVACDQLDDRDMVIDFADLDFVDECIKTRWDHRHLNDYMENPTAEVIAERFGNFVIGEVRGRRRTFRVAVTVHETHRCFARWESGQVW